MIFPVSFLKWKFYGLCSCYSKHKICVNSSSEKYNYCDRGSTILVCNQIMCCENRYGDDWSIVQMIQQDILYWNGIYFGSKYALYNHTNALELFFKDGIRLLHSSFCKFRCIVISEASTYSRLSVINPWNCGGCFHFQAQSLYLTIIYLKVFEWRTAIDFLHTILFMGNLGEKFHLINCVHRVMYSWYHQFSIISTEYLHFMRRWCSLYRKYIAVEMMWYAQFILPSRDTNFYVVTFVEFIMFIISYIHNVSF